MPNSYAFAYNDPSTGAAEVPLAMFEYPMNQTNYPVALVRTLQSLSESYATNFSYLLYNDEPSEDFRPGANYTAPISYGHTKGVVADGGSLPGIGAQGGLWLLHSTPKFPEVTGGGQFWFPESEITYGQTFLCMSLDTDDLDAVGEQLLLTRPFVYKATGLFRPANGTENATHPTPSGLLTATYPALASVVAKRWNTSASGTAVRSLNSGSPGKPGLNFTSIAKNKEWGGDLWEQLVATHFGSGLLVESWIRGHALGPYCPPNATFPYMVVDAEALVATLPSGDNVTWKETQDHAKWAITTSPGVHAAANIVCVGDINRMSSQRKRGGGAVCFQDKNLHFGLQHTVLSSESCPNSTTPSTASSREAAQAPALASARP